MLEKKNIHGSQSNLFNLIALIVSPNSTCDKNGTVKVSHVKAAEISKICDDTESLISNSKPSLLKVLLSQYLYRKTGSSETMTNLAGLGELPYTESKFIQDKLAKWSKNNPS